MVCVKCSCEWFRQTEDDLTCCNCGALYFIERPPVLAMPKEQKYDPRTKSIIYDFISTNFEEITLKRRDGYDWADITRWIRRSGQVKRVLEPTVAKYYTFVKETRNKT